MPTSRSHQPPTRFTVTNTKHRREISADLLSQITHISMLQYPLPCPIASRTFHLNVKALDHDTFQVVIQYRNIHIGSTVAQLHVKPSATDLAAALDALQASLSDGWIWQIS